MKKIIIQHSNPDNESIKRIIEEGKNNGLKVFFANDDDFVILYENNKEKVFYKGIELIKENFNALYLRQIASKINTYKVIANYAKENGVFVVDYEGIQNYGEKINTYNKIKNNLIHLNLIPTYSITGNNFDFKLSFSYPVIYKPINGKEGIGVELIKNKK